ncbi:hypothetical protein J1N35_014426 [Gossypium stocksii]|uniref:Uncharacterized protein n=1 Tax=Gossypium stocksii TaxID=47602 RepID=A0A9D4A8V6_9ROSI|nr:hypothetical protein J1N35_014426 [Gossypium stocksii]
MQKSHKDFQQKESFNLDFHEILCEKLTVCGFAFSSHFELLDVAFDDMTMPLEFSIVPDLPQLPSFLLGEPSCRNIKWSYKMQLVGPILPLPILLALYEFRNGCPNSEKMCGFSSEMEFGLRFNEVMRVIAEMAKLDFCLLNNDESVSLTHVVGKARGNRIYNDVKFTTMIIKVYKVIDPNDTMDRVGLELFDDLCPIEFKFDVTIENFVLMNALCLIEE